MITWWTVRVMFGQMSTRLTVRVMFGKMITWLIVLDIDWIND
jgi:hypothetical protein